MGWGMLWRGFGAWGVALCVSGRDRAIERKVWVVAHPELAAARGLWESGVQCAGGAFWGVYNR